MIVDIKRKFNKAVKLLIYRIKQKRFRDIIYLPRNEKSNTNTLIIVFSAFSKIGMPPKYNYCETLQSVDAMQIYILDNSGYNKAGSYYLGEDGDWYIPEQIYELVSNICQKYNKSRIITCGSSKGGTAAAFYGLKLHADAIVIGAPQYKIGEYLYSDEHMPILQKIIGKVTEENMEMINNLLRNAIRESAHMKNKPVFHIHYSPEEHTYKEHISELISELQLNNYTLELDNAYSYTEHGDVGQYFKSYLHRVCDNFVEAGKQN